MRRRTVVLVGLLAWPLGGIAQPAGRVARIGFIGGSAPDPAVLRAWVEPLRQGLRELGYVEGRNFTMEFRWSEGKQEERLPGLLAELIALAPDVLVTLGPRVAILAKDATTTIPIVALGVDDPVVAGLAVSYARPGRNITGLSGAFQGILERRPQSPAGGCAEKTPARGRVESCWASAARSTVQWAVDDVWANAEWRA